MNILMHRKHRTNEEERHAYKKMEGARRSRGWHPSQSGHDTCARIGSAAHVEGRNRPSVATVALSDAVRVDGASAICRAPRSDAISAGGLLHHGAGHAP